MYRSPFSEVYPLKGKGTPTRTPPEHGICDSLRFHQVQYCYKKGYLQTQKGGGGVLGHPEMGCLTSRLIWAFLALFRLIEKLHAVLWVKHRLKTAQNHLFEHPKWSRNNFVKIILDHFFTYR